MAKIRSRIQEAYPGARRGPLVYRRLGSHWIPASAGMTKYLGPVMEYVTAILT
jgi:hypothetical protein